MLAIKTAPFHVGHIFILSIARKYEVHGNLFIPLIEKQNPWTKTS